MKYHKKLAALHYFKRVSIHAWLLVCLRLLVKKNRSEAGLGWT